MYPEISMVCDFFCRYLINSNLFNLEQILNFKTNLRAILTSKYKQYTWDKKQPLKGNACRSILVLKSTLDPILIEAGYKSGILEINEKDLYLKSEHNQEVISNLNISINDFSKVITIIPPPELDEDSFEESSKKISIIDNSPSLKAIKTNVLEKGKGPVKYEAFKAMFLSKGEIVLWCDPGSVSYSIDDGQIITLYDKNKEKAEHKKTTKNHKGSSPNVKKTGSVSPYLSDSSLTNSKKSPLILPAAAISKKDKKKNKKKEKKEEAKSKTSSSIKKVSKPQTNHTTVNDILKNVIFDEQLIVNENCNLTNKTKHLSTSSATSIYSNVNFNPVNSQYKIFNSMVVDSKMPYSSDLVNKRNSLLAAIPNTSEIINNELNSKSKIKNTLSSNYKNKIISTMNQASSATNRFSGSFTEKTYPFLGLLSRSAVIV
ncbi:hypothetical protein BCR36DRAFT_585823 [Piromyces finnis]|uniref:Anti-proliferative protein domain-containing protein n=1 Tax=Piromyces finnis TaxID=1754191 RepID=A0A1Y1V2N4_9FUNG|nr:hypothetical protein BCR36DRAFT_585823 [Piromyces finnis]|eukprot:ORX45216.1 hypothetical protein BCR36DRAFT_585823 [Piromyces finnis]